MSASKLPPFCADCRKRHAIMIVLRAPTGPWQLCSPCWLASKHEADRETADRERKLAKREGRQRKTHNRERVGSHG